MALVHGDLHTSPSSDGCMFMVPRFTVGPDPDNPGYLCLYRRKHNVWGGVDPRPVRFPSMQARDEANTMLYVNPDPPHAPLPPMLADYVAEMFAEPVKRA